MRTSKLSVLSALALFIASLGWTAEEPVVAGPALVAELGCAHCHASLKIKTTLRDRTPALSSAGLRYNPAYLFDFLKNPVKVRHHLGRARMPNFNFDDKEALAVVKFLQAQQQIGGRWPALPSELGSRTASTQITKDDFQKEVSSDVACLNCHRFEGKGGTIGIELSDIGHRLQPDWVKRYLALPEMFGVSPQIMPPQFYRVEPAEQRLQEIAPNAVRRIERITDYLFSLAAGQRNKLAQKLQTAESKYPDVSASLGEKIFVAENCAACHRHQTIAPRPDSAPDLSIEADRVKSTWLTAFLKKPSAVRPFGFHPGDGSRMPDFHLSDQEIDSLRPLLLTHEEKTSQRVVLSAFSKEKAALLLSQKLSCLGCHRLGDQGGRIGPDLTQASSRLQPKYVSDTIRDPRRLHPASIMPKIALPDRTVELIGNYILAQTEASPRPSDYLSLTENRIILPFTAGGERARSNYLTYCAACHGPEGLGNGWNAPFLAAKPTMHANAQFMSTRPDDTLFDGIYGGSYILGKSSLMPPWGRSLAPQEINELVAYLRTLCYCQQPQWAADHRPDSGPIHKVPKP